MSQSQGSNNNDAFYSSVAQFMQAGHSMAQHFMNLLGQAGNQGSVGEQFIDQQKLAELQKNFANEHMQLWQAVLTGGNGNGSGQAVRPEPGDRRFSALEWRESPVYDYMHQIYLLSSKYTKDLIELVPAESRKQKDRLRFLARQYIDAMAPSNFAATNPEFIKLAIETKGQSITDGIANLIKDLEKGRISMTDEAVFKVGENLAITEGAVIFENELMQLIQYAPLTPKVAARPLVVVPPCINKFYIMDLQPENSLIRYMVEQGNTVFLVSWRNPKEDSGYLTWDDYLEMGPLVALRIAREVCGSSQVNALGFCVGGTILTSALAVMQARGEDFVSSLTLLTTLLDFADTGEIGLFIDEASIVAREAAIGKGGLMAARELQNTFSSLRANDLIWNYVTGNYLKGQKPPPFDLLYWNSDSTNLPGPFACWYMRNFYLDNSLRVPGKLQMCGARVDLGRLRMPAYFLATREDHIVPWQSAYRGTALLGGENRFVLGASGHIAGVINPVSKNKRSYWVNPDAGADPEEWLAAAEERKGSWWSDWAAWLAQFAGGESQPRTPGSSKYKPIEPAPGRYVKERAV